MNKARILIVEDELIVAEDLKMTLVTLGYEVVGISVTGEHAIELAGETRPDVILMDIMLAGELDGIATAGKIRAQYDIPVIYVTAYADENLVARAKLTEPFGYIVKPFNEREVNSNIEISLYRHRIERELKKRDAILLALGSGIEWFLREFIASHTIPPPASSKDRAGYSAILENIGIAMDLVRIVIFRSDAGSGALSPVAEWAVQDLSPLPKARPVSTLNPALLGLESRKEDLRMGRAVPFGIDTIDPSLRDILRSYRFRSMVALDLQVRDQSYGLIIFVSDRDRSWPPEELDAMRIAANIVGTAIGISGKSG
ncbi:response regulator [Methanoregula sp. PtaB.Bin085]|uniref:response regulator n=1 Tax=Methanoregula sp. PtaB.Bin085 TaxID=1811680 RepID=UPI0009C4FE18|nr:response regulator [Methanoregula sp. PtaB.Bin085]OPX64441.1 MAG: two-component response regulator [Methanoregula sp. PtaB.Bin085]